MRIQFLLRHAGCLRMLDSTLRTLATNGHEVHLIYNLEGDRVGHDLTELLVKDCPRITYEFAPALSGPYSLIGRQCVNAIDWLRYKDPRYAQSPRLAQRAEGRVRKGGRLVKRSLDALVTLIGWQKSICLFQWVLPAIPRDAKVLEFLKARPCDVMVVTPLVDFGSEQAEFLLAAKALGRRTMLLVHSWDNLTNKGLIRVIPDRVLVWNEAQKNEAIEMHGVPGDRIVVTGAQCYDIWYSMRPKESRDEFCRRVGLDPYRPYILYTGSSPFIGADAEPALVHEFLNAMRGSILVALQDVQILVRPHPQNAHPWDEIEDGHGMAIYPRGGALPVEVSARTDYYDSIYHSAAVVGVNTSAMIEASIIGRPVLSILDERFRETQQGTLHFHHLLNGGHLLVGRDMEDLLEKLDGILGHRLDHRAGTRMFLDAFIRPHGPDDAGTPRVVDAILGLAGQPETGLKRNTNALLLAKLLILPFLPLAWAGCKYALRGKKRKNKKGKVARKSKSANGKILGKIPVADLADKSTKLLTGAQAARKPWKDLSGARDYYVQGIKGDEKELLVRMKEAYSGKRVVLGPWLSEVGFEVLYWVPFLRWLAKEGVYDPAQALLLTRGGADAWYPGLFDKSIDIFSLVTSEDFKQKNDQRTIEFGTQKHIGIGTFDKYLIERAAESIDLHSYAVIHPSEMYRYFQPLLAGKGGRAPLEIARRALQFERLPVKNSVVPLGKLPDSYIAVKFYYRTSFEDTVENRQFVSQLLHELAQHHEVVLLNTRMEFDDHSECEPETRARLHRIDDLMTPENNLALQSEVIARSRAFFGTYGGLSYVPLFYGVPSFAFKTSSNGLNWTHLHLANEVALDFDVPFHLFNTHDFSFIREMMKEHD